MPRLPIPAPGFKPISGKRRPPSSMGTELWCQIRGGCPQTAGWVDSKPWPVATTNFIHDGTAGDVVAVRAVNDD